MASAVLRYSVYFDAMASRTLIKHCVNTLRNNDGLVQYLRQKNFNPITFMTQFSHSQYWSNLTILCNRCIFSFYNLVTISITSLVFNFPIH